MGITIKRAGSVLCELSGVRSSSWHGTVAGERSFSFTVPAALTLSAAVGDQVEFNSDIFDIVRISRQTDIPSASSTVDCEHVSYRLADMEQDAAVFTGTAAAVLAQILQGTGFSVGTVSVSGTYTLTVTEATNKRDVLQQWVSKVSGELQLSGMSISIVPHVGSTVRQELSDKKNVRSISVTLDSRSETQTYGVTLYRETALHLGDEVSINYPSLGLAVNSRIISIDYDPFQRMQYILTCGALIPNWTNSVINSLQEKVGLGKKYYGNTISREYGFKSEIDGGGYGLFNADGITFTDENGKRCMYYDADAGTFIINGTLGSDAIFTDSLYAEQGEVAELTVDRVSTSKRIRMYLLHDTSDDLFVRVQDRYVQWVAATPSTGGGTDDGPLLTEAEDTLITEGGDVLIAETSVTVEQAENRYGELLWWQKDISNATISAEGYPFVDGEQVYVTTQNTGYPVMTYAYDEFVKLQIAFELDGMYYSPIITLGAGDENGHSKMVLKKTAAGVSLMYDRSDGGGLVGWELNNSGKLLKTVNGASWPMRGAAVSTDIAVPASDWVSDSTYSAYPYHADVDCDAAAPGLAAAVVFDPDSQAGMAQYAACGTGYVRIYAASAPVGTVTIRRLEVMA